MTGKESGRESEFDAKQTRLEHPSGWLSLTRFQTTRLLIDALLESPPGHPFNKSELQRRTGMSRDSIREHLPFLVELGIVEEIDEGGWPEYVLNDDGKVTQELFELNSAVNSVLSGEKKNVNTGPEIDLSHVDRSEWDAAKNAQDRLREVKPDA